MKHKVSKQFTSILLALVMIIGMIPASALTAFAAGKTEVAQIETRISAEHVPYAGKAYKDLYTWIDAVIYGSAQTSGSDWVDDSGMTIEIKGDGDYDEWYDIRYQFEAGRTYTTEYTYMIYPAYEETHKFTEKTVVALTNPDPSKCTVTGEVIEVRDSGRICDVRYTMTIAGERSYPDIQSATLQKIATPADGVQAETTALMYSNCTLTSQSWSPNVVTFEAGNTYTLTVNLHANDGYKFADDFAPVLGIKGYEKAADTVELLNSNKDAAVSFTYSVGNYTFIDTLKLYPITGAADFFPVAGESAIYFPELFKPADGAPYEKEWLGSRQWYNEDDKKNMESGDLFEAGKTYRYHSIFRIKRENEGNYRFASPTVQLGNFIYKNDVQTEVGDDPLRIYVTFTYTCQFPKGVGDSAGNPAMCNSYEEFKFAMENEDIRYVTLGNVADTMTKKEGDSLIFGILVDGHKRLNLLGDAVFYAPFGNNIKSYDSLLQVETGSSLYIQGSGSLAFKAIASAGRNAVVCNQGGTVVVESGTLVGSYNVATYGMAIWQEYGDLTVNGGTLRSENAASGSNDHYPVYLMGGTTNIYGGTFYAENASAGTGNVYGVSITNEATVTIFGGTFKGIKLGSGARVGNYLEDGHTMIYNGEKVANPNNYATIPGNVTVEVYKEVSNVDININAPTAGDYISNEVYSVPEWCYIHTVKWYEDGEPVSDTTFAAGKSYKVEIYLMADDNAKFANSLTSATINYKNATVTAFSDDIEKGIVMTVDLGICPAVVSEVSLSVDAPKEQQTFGSVIRGDKSYSVDDSQWLVSDTGEDGSWTVMQTGEKFVAGKYYKLGVDLKVTSGYSFRVDSDLDPYISATVNGYTAKVTRVYEQAADEMIHVEYYFGLCNETVIKSVVVNDIVAPVVGEYPAYTCSFGGSGYEYYTDMDNPTYRKNGITWYDVTTGDDVIQWNDETFVAGHTYKLYITVRAEDGYDFNSNIAATVNGDGNVTAGVDRVWCTLTYTFTCQPRTIKSVGVTGITVPVPGANPDFTAVVDLPEYYQLDPDYGIGGIIWYDDDMNEMTAEDAFGDYEQYRLTIQLIPVAVNGTNACKFDANNTSVTVNGRTVKTSSQTWDEVSGSNKRVVIYYTFTKTPDGVFVSGTVTSFNSDTDDVTVQLISSGTSEVAYKTVVTGNSANYYISGVNPDTYTVKVMKNNHVTREYQITVDSDAVMLNAKIHLKGDINGDGRVNISDVGLANAHAKKSSTLEGYQLYCADVNGDDKINISDVGLLNAHAKKTSLLW